MTAQEIITPDRPVVAPPRAIGTARVCVGEAGRLRDLRQSGSMKLLFPRMAGGATQAVLLNTAGGITGGDRFDVQAAAMDGGHLALTTQAAERAYAAQPGSTGHLTTRIEVGAGARVDWLPQETILFDRAALRRRLEIDLAPGATCLMAEPLILGRAAMGESVRQLAFDDRITLRRDGRPVFVDATRISGDAATHLAQPHIAGGAGALALVVLASPLAEAHLDPVRDMLPVSAGASLLTPQLLVVRLLARDGFTLRQTLVPLLTRLSGADLPRPWMI